MIPVLICPVVSRPDQLETMLASIDEPVGRLVVIDMTPDGIEPLCARRGAERLRPLVSPGLAGAINLGIGQTPEAPWWMFSSSDLVYGPGDLAEIVALIEMDPDPCFVTGDRADDRLLRNAYGAVNVAAIEAVGLLDEWTFYPLYFDDDDWERRCRLGGVEWVEYNGSILHERSSTIASDASAQADNARTFPVNLARYVDKWGGPPGAERYATPWDTGAPLAFTRPDPAGRAARAWR